MISSELGDLLLVKCFSVHPDPFYLEDKRPGAADARVAFEDSSLDQEPPSFLAKAILTLLFDDGRRLQAVGESEPCSTVAESRRSAFREMLSKLVDTKAYLFPESFVRRFRARSIIAHHRAHALNQGSKYPFAKGRYKHYHALNAGSEPASFDSFRAAFVHYAPIALASFVNQCIADGIRPFAPCSIVFGLTDEGIIQGISVKSELVDSLEESLGQALRTEILERAASKPVAEKMLNEVSVHLVSVHPSAPGMACLLVIASIDMGSRYVPSDCVFLEDGQNVVWVRRACPKTGEFNTVRLDHKKGVPWTVLWLSLLVAFAGVGVM